MSQEIQGSHLRCSVLPASKSRAWGSTGAITEKLSLTALGEPGRFTINVPEQTPHTPLDNIAIGVAFSDCARIASAMPGASRSMTRCVASGVLSRGPRPVPPVVMIKLTSVRAANSRSVCTSGSRSSERILVSTISALIDVSSSTSAAPDSSCRSPREQASLAVMTTALMDMIHKIFRIYRIHLVHLENLANPVTCFGCVLLTSSDPLQPSSQHRVQDESPTTAIVRHSSSMRRMVSFELMDIADSQLHSMKFL